MVQEQSVPPPLPRPPETQLLTLLNVPAKQGRSGAYPGLRYHPTSHHSSATAQVSAVEQGPLGPLGLEQGPQTPFPGAKQLYPSPLSQAPHLSLPAYLH